MKVRIGTNSSAPEVIGKKIEWLKEVNALFFRDNFDVQTPVIILDGWSNDGNYCQFTVDGKVYQYFIISSTQLTGSRVQLSLKCDVLETYKNVIANLNVVSERATDHFNRYVADGIQLMSSKPQIQYKLLSGTPFDVENISGLTRCVAVRAVVKERSAE